MIRIELAEVWRVGTAERNELHGMEGSREANCVDHTWKEFPFWRATRRKFAADSTFFSAGNLERELQAKQASLNITEEEKFVISRLEEEQTQQVSCPIVGCGAILKSVADLESHYAVRHTATCSVCSHVYPTTRLLNLHVSETHDSFFQAKVARNYPMYECLVESCPGRFQSDGRRLQHLVDRHHFPKTFRFHSSKHLSKKHRQRQKQHAYKQPQPSLSEKRFGNSKPKQKRPSSVAEVPSVSDVQKARERQEDPGKSCLDTPADAGAMDVDSLTEAVSRLSTASTLEDSMPAVVSFGRRRNRACTVQPTVHRQKHIDETRARETTTSRTSC